MEDSTVSPTTKMNKKIENKLAPFTTRFSLCVSGSSLKKLQMICRFASKGFFHLTVNGIPGCKLRINDSQLQWLLRNTCTSSHMVQGTMKRMQLIAMVDCGRCGDQSLGQSQGWWRKENRQMSGKFLCEMLTSTVPEASLG